MVKLNHGGASVVRLMLAMVSVLGLLSIASCSEANRDGDSTSMSFSSGEYNTGYKDGMRDAKMALFDDHAAWLWLWMVDAEYGRGYDRGWADGRRTLDLESQQRESNDRATRDAEQQS